ncbi:hypothetical protein EAI_03301 [Harpegnathos saltator]|uniref:Uncharacterized protein n=1 Tax=Harpegnathos saltator TaxID=610380 RepID=E2BH08_HARSA|nr:hypothetical protein EAI_03301 [Harpegnathos saltator]
MTSMMPRRRFVTESDNDACHHNSEENGIRLLSTTIQGSMEREFASSLQLEQPIYVQFDSFEQRLATFDQWLRNALPSRRHHRDLASNERDATITDDTFDPWREHLYWSRECSWAKVVCRVHFLNEDTAEPESEKAASLIPAPRRPIRFDRGDGVNGILGMEENKCTSVGETAQKRSSIDENECGLNLRRFTAYDNQRRRRDFDERIADRMLMGYIPVATRSIDTNDTVGVTTLSDRLNDLRLATQRDIKEYTQLIESFERMCCNTSNSVMQIENLCNRANLLLNVLRHTDHAAIRENLFLVIEQSQSGSRINANESLTAMH